MNEQKRINRILRSLSCVEEWRLVLIPHMVETQCILAAKTAESRKRLVRIARLAAQEDYTRIIRSYTRSQPKKTFFQKLMELIP